MKKIITSGEQWRTEEEFFEACRRDEKLERIEEKWSGGSRPIILVKWGYVEREEWEKCFWIKYPSKVRCEKCKWTKECPSYVK